MSKMPFTHLTVGTLRAMLRKARATEGWEKGVSEKDRDLNLDLKEDK